jgi:protein-tyrosine phosphatase
MRQILDDIDAALEDDRPVYVHCWGGKGRAGTVVGCYLVRHKLAAPDAALARITELRQGIIPSQASPETQEQCDFVRGWKPGQ